MDDFDEIIRDNGVDKLLDKTTRMAQEEVAIIWTATLLELHERAQQLLALDAEERAEHFYKLGVLWWDAAVQLAGVHGFNVVSGEFEEDGDDV